MPRLGQGECQSQVPMPTLGLATHSEGLGGTNPGFPGPPLGPMSNLGCLQDSLGLGRDKMRSWHKARE